jgi:hypothetical protein
MAVNMSTSANQAYMGSRPGQMNLYAVRMRVEETRRTIDSLLQTLQFAPSALQWNDAVDKFAVLNVQIHHILMQLRPLLRHYVIHPRSVNEFNAPLLPLMLATTKLPEQEDQDAKLIDAPNQEIWDAADIVDALTKKDGLLDPKGPRRLRLGSSFGTSTRDGAMSKQNGDTEDACAKDLLATAFL